MSEAMMEQREQGDDDEAREDAQPPATREEEEEAEEFDDESAGPQAASGASADPFAGQDPEKVMQRLDGEARRHRNRVGEIMGEGVLDLLPCPLCPDNLPGFVWPVAPPEEIVSAVREFLGEDVNPEYKKAEDAAVCAPCDGLGWVLTGSRVKEQRTKPCTACNGNGWRNVHGPPVDSSTAPPPAAGAQTVTAPSEPAGPPDVWARPFGHPHYAIPPSMVGVS